MSKQKQKDLATDTVVEPAAKAAPEKRSPVKTFVIDNVSASIFVREHEVRGVPTKFYSVSFTRSYKDSTGRYNYAKSFDLDDLGRLVTVAQQAAEYIREQLDADEAIRRQD